MQRTPSNSRSSMDRAPGKADKDEGERERGVAHRVNPLPLRETEEEELSEADILEEHDLEELDVDDLARMEGPDA